jgi:hypothetical protein
VTDFVTPGEGTGTTPLGPQQNAAKRRKRTPAKIGTARTLHQIKARVALMRWSEHIDDAEGNTAHPSPLVPGSLADEFWNKDIPRLIAQVERGLRDAD